MVEQIQIEIEVEEYVDEIEIDLEEAIILGTNILKESQTKSQNIIANGYYEITPDDGYILEKVNINVVVPIPEGYLKPEGTIEITSNGVVDVKNYGKANVNVNAPVVEEYDGTVEVE